MGYYVFKCLEDEEYVLGSDWDINARFPTDYAGVIRVYHHGQLHRMAEIQYRQTNKEELKCLKKKLEKADRLWKRIHKSSRDSGGYGKPAQPPPLVSTDVPTSTSTLTHESQAGPSGLAHQSQDFKHSDDSSDFSSTDEYDEESDEFPDPPKVTRTGEDGRRIRVWTTPEKEILEDAFTFTLSHPYEYPDRTRARRLRMKHPVLTQRTPEQIIAWVHNERKRRLLSKINISHSFTS